MLSSCILGLGAVRAVVNDFNLKDDVSKITTGHVHVHYIHLIVIVLSSIG